MALTNLVATYFSVSDGPAEAKAAATQEIVKTIVSGESKLVTLIQELGSRLKNEDSSERAQAIECLSDVVCALPSEKYTPLETGHLITFFLAKFDEVLAFKPVLKSLKKLVPLAPSDENLQKILRIIKDEYNPKNYNASSRCLVFELLAEIIDFPLISNNDLFISAFVHAASGEKDPKNLMLSFALNEKIVSQLENIPNFVEDLFDVSFCYFPIAFKPPKNDPYGISTEDLKQALRSALTASPVLIGELLPNLFEKFASSAISVKQDVLDTLSLSIKRIDVESLEKHWLEIWEALKFEILHDTDPSYDLILRKVYDIVHGIPEPDLSLLPVDEKETQDRLKMLASVCVIFTQIAAKVSLVVPKMVEDLTGDNKQTYLILSMISQASSDAFEEVVSKRFRALVTGKDLSVDENLTVLKEIYFFEHAYINLFGENGAPRAPLVETGSFFAYRDDVVLLLSRALTGSSKEFTNLKIEALRGLNLLVKARGYLTESDLRVVLSDIKGIIMNYINTEDSDVETVFKKIYPFCLQVLVSVSRSNLDLIIIEFLPHLFSALPDSSVGIGSSLEKVEKTLQALSDMCVEDPGLLETLFIRLMAKLEIVSQEAQSSKYITSILSMLYTSFSEFCEKNLEFLFGNKFLEKGVVNMLKLCLSNRIFYSDVDVELCSRVVFLLVLNSSSTVHQKILDSSVELFLRGNSESMDLKMDQLILEKPSKYCHLFAKILAGIDFKQATPKFENPEELLTMIFNMVEASAGLVYEKQGYLQLLCVLTNKWLLENQFPAEILSKLSEGIQKTGSASDLEIYIWISKAIIMRNHDLSESCLRTILDFYVSSQAKNSTFGDRLCKGVEVLVDEGPFFKNYSMKPKSQKKKLFSVSKKNNVRMNPLYKQRLFEIVVPQFIELFRNANKNYQAGEEDAELKMALTKKYCLTSICYISRHMKTEILLLKLEEFFPLIVESVKIENSTIKIAALETLSSLIMSNTSKLVGSYLSSLIPSLITCFKSANYFKKDINGGSHQLLFDPELVKLNSPQVRELSLVCLTKFTEYLDLIKLVPFKAEVLKNLEIPLDDKKRSVRRLACICRQQYFELGQVKS